MDLYVLLCKSGTLGLDSRLHFTDLAILLKRQAMGEAQRW